MLKVVFDSAVFISAFLVKTGLSAELLRKARDGAFDICLAEEILEEVRRALLQYQKIRKRYYYQDQAAIQFVQSLRVVTRLTTNLPTVKVVDSDPNDDMVVACALKAQAGYIITRDNDLLSLGKHEGIEIVTPEAFMGMLRGGIGQTNG